MLRIDALDGLDDAALERLIGEAPILRCGIGGSGSVMEIEGRPVYVKRIPLTDVEYRERSTANLFKLPACCHYGIGSPGFNAWRELAAHQKTPVAPALYHWRVLAIDPGVELGDADASPYGADAPQVQARIDAVASASHSFVLFMEYVPYSLLDWLGRASLEVAVALVEGQLESTVAAMNGAGVLHFDGHFGNILTDGQRLLFTDFALAASPDFELTDEERLFVERHQEHDRLHVRAQWINWLVTSLARPADRNAYIEACAGGAPATGLPPPAAAVVEQHARSVADFNRFYRTIFLHDRHSPWPF